MPSKTIHGQLSKVSESYGSEIEENLKSDDPRAFELITDNEEMRFITIMRTTKSQLQKQ